MVKKKQTIEILEKSIFDLIEKFRIELHLLFHKELRKYKMKYFDVILFMKINKNYREIKS